jgi:hypothetical protein
VRAINRSGGGGVGSTPLSGADPGRDVHAWRFTRSPAAAGCCVPQRLEHLTAHQQGMQQHREFASHRYLRDSFRDLRTPLGQLRTVTFEIRVRRAAPRDVVRGLHQQPTQMGIACFRDSRRLIPITRLPLTRRQPQERPHTPTVPEPIRISEGQQERQRSQSPHPWHLRQQLRAWIGFGRQTINLNLEGANLLR